VIAFKHDAITDLAQVSDNAAPILGLETQTLTLVRFRAHVHPDDLARVTAHHRSARADGPATLTFRFIRPDGREVWLEETSQVEFDAAGRPASVKGLMRDITKRKQAEMRQDLLIAELDHRVKNLLARVVAIVMQTRHGWNTVDAFVTALHGRIQSMAAAHALLSQSRWTDVRLSDLIRHQLAPYATDANTTVTGPAIMLTSAQTQAVAMVVHELVTNAAKHGALSCSDGRVRVGWSRTGVDASGLTIAWQESGGPPIKPAVRSGYGSDLIRGLIPHELGGTVDLTFPCDGACCTIEIPLQSASVRRHDELRSAICEHDGCSTGVRKFFKKLGAAVQREIEHAAGSGEGMRKLAGTILPIRAVVTVSGIDLKFELCDDIELA